MIRAGAADAVKAVQNMVANPEHKDHARAVSMVLDRTDPVITNSHVAVTHRIIDPVQEELAEYLAAIELGAGPEKLRDLFGGNRLAHLEAMAAEEAAKRAKIINAQVIEQEPNGSAKED
jgi:hypothetical protein